MVITGVGSRKTPREVLNTMTRIGAWCRQKRVPLRSGHADGADWAFEQGAQEFCIAYLPWRGFRVDYTSRARNVLYKPSPETEAWVDRLHPNAGRLMPGARKLHGRNVWQVLGSKLNTPSSALVCWTPGAKLVGGTRTAIVLAQEHGIPVFNLAAQGEEEVLESLYQLWVAEELPW